MQEYEGEKRGREKQRMKTRGRTGGTAQYTAVENNTEQIQLADRLVLAAVEPAQRNAHGSTTEPFRRRLNEAQQSFVATPNCTRNLQFILDI